MLHSEHACTIWTSSTAFVPSTKWVILRSLSLISLLVFRYSINETHSLCAAPGSTVRLARFLQLRRGGIRALRARRERRLQLDHPGQVPRLQRASSKKQNRKRYVRCSVIFKGVSLHPAAKPFLIWQVFVSSLFCHLRLPFARS